MEGEEKRGRRGEERGGEGRRGGREGGKGRRGEGKGGGAECLW